MSNMPQRLARPSSRNLLTRVLDQPDLPTQIQTLPPVVFGKLIDKIGLEDAGELVALATVEQLAHAFDEDLWKNQRPGEEERFDADRFLVWLEVLLEAGDAFVATKLAQMPEDLVTLAFHKHMLVLDVEALALDMQAADEVDARQLDKVLESCLYEEVNGFQLMARDPDGWDSILSAVLALDRDHHEFLQRVLEHCCAMSTEYIEDNGGLYEVLTSDEMLEADVAGDREDRRAEAGHVAPSSAAAFLKLSRTGTPTPDGERDPMTRAYFRNIRPAGNRTPPISRQASAHARLVSGTDPQGLNQILKEAGVLVEASPKHLLMPPAQASDPWESLLVDAMRALADDDPQAFGERSEELAYLTNVLLAGCSLQQRRLRPIEAVRAALAVCNLGLCLTVRTPASGHAADPPKEALATLRQLKADSLFRHGWHRLQGDVVDAAARIAIRILREAAANPDDLAERAPCKRAALTLDKALQEGTPWQAMSVLDSLLCVLDARDLEKLSALMDQCPSLPVAADHAAAGDDKASGARPRRYLSTPAALDEARCFLETLKVALPVADAVPNAEVSGAGATATSPVGAAKPLDRPAASKKPPRASSRTPTNTKRKASKPR